MWTHHLHLSRALAIGVVMLALLPGVASAGSPMANLPARLAALESALATLQGTVGTLQGQVSTLQTQNNTLQSTVGVLEGRVHALETENAAQQAAIISLQGALAGASTVFALGQYLTVDTTAKLVRFSGVNVQLVNGSPNTDARQGGPSALANGLGNLLIGYDGSRPWDNDKTGSHYLVIRDYHNYSQFGGMVVGYMHTVSGPYASVSGGAFNTASGPYASVSGGWSRTATGWYNWAAGWLWVND